MSTGLLCFAYVCWKAMFAGVWSCGTARRGLVFALLSCTWISVDRMVLDMPWLALCAAAVWLLDRGHPNVAACPLARACLSRETGVLFRGALAMAALLDRRRWG